MPTQHQRTRIPGKIDPLATGGIGFIVDKPSCNLWIVASDLALADDDTVTSWTPRKGGVWSSASGTPKYKTNIINGLPAVYLANDTFFGFATISIRTIVCVLSAQNDNYRFFMGNTAANTAWHGDTSKWASTFYANAAWHGASVYKSGTYQGTAGAVARSATISQWSFVLTGALAANRFSQGNNSGRNLLGYVAELFAFDTTIPSEDFNTLVSYLCTKYGL